MTTNAQAALTAAASSDRDAAPVLRRADKYLEWLNTQEPTGIKLPTTGVSQLSLNEDDQQIAKAIEYAQTIHPVRNDAEWKTYLEHTLRHRLNPSDSQTQLRLIIAEAANGFIAGRKAEFMRISAPVVLSTPDELLAQKEHAQKEAELNLRATMIVATLQASGAIKGEPQPVDWANAFKLAKKQAEELAGDEWPPPVAAEPKRPKAKK